MEKEQKCCTVEKGNSKKFFLSGIFYGLIPHSFCLAFALFSIIGAVAASAFLKKVLLINNIFYYLILVFLVLATLSIYIYLRRTNCLCKSGIKDNWKYITILYSTTLIINLVFFYSVIPALANIGSNKTTINQQGVAEVSLKVNIPCTGHSFLIIDELKKDVGVTDVKFEAPDVFKTKYNSQITNVGKITSLEIFRTFKITVQ